MSRKVTIMMCHHVRDLWRSRYPAINGLFIECFCHQLDHISLITFTPLHAHRSRGCVG